MTTKLPWTLLPKEDGVFLRIVIHTPSGLPSGETLINLGPKDQVMEAMVSLLASDEYGRLPIRTVGDREYYERYKD